MKIKQTSIVGTMESSDIMIKLEPGVGIIDIDLSSTVEKQFGEEIKRVISEVITEYGVVSAKVTAIDMGALNCTIRARVKTALSRSVGLNDYSWERSAT